MRLLPAPRHRVAPWLLLASVLCAPGHAQVLEAPTAQAPLASVPLDASVRFKPFRDPWRPARERWRDVADNPLSAFLSAAQKFSYTGEAGPAPQVTLSYSSAPPVPYFIGRIDATGLKPNFAYQLKLAAKPTKGARGWGAHGHEPTNEKLGYAGRWWCGHPIHASGTNFDDAHYVNEYKNAPRGMEHDIYGYIYMGQFITDGRGEAHHTFFGDHPYHISWLSWQGSANWTAWQGGAKDVLAMRPQVLGAPLSNGDFYGYGVAAPSTSVTLFYENEPGRAQPLTLPPGDYNCRFLITEESFHNPVNSTPEGGYWKTVLATEDFAYDQAGRIVAPDAEASNDVAFTIGSGPSVRAMRAQVEVSIERPKAGQARATARVLVTDAIGRPIRGATVSGQWTGLHRQVPVSATTNSTGIGGTGTRGDGLAQFSTPEVRAGRGGCFGFVVTNVSKAGRTWNGGQNLGAQGCL